MARHVHVDLIGGLAGDMFLAAALDAGLVALDALQELLRGVGLGDVVVHAGRVVRYGVEGTHVSFSGWDPAHDHDHRHLSEIHEMLQASALPDAVKARAAALFDALGRAESEVHAVPMERVHFHEVGAVDSLLDFVGAAWVIEQVGGTWSFGAIPRGQGTVQMAHGPMPSMAPATAKLLTGQLIETRPVNAELVTPTGAAILVCLPSRDAETPGVLVSEGFGAGTRDLDGLANVVRLTVYEVAEGIEGGARDVNAETHDMIHKITCEIDDMTPEAIADAAIVLMDMGALDVTREPVTMKKGRLGTRITTLASQDMRDALVRAVLTHTTTFGVRVEAVARVKLARSFASVDTPFGAITVKLGALDGRVIKASPEYEDCAAAARAHDRPVHEVMEAARDAARGLIDEIDT